MTTKQQSIRYRIALLAEWRSKHPSLASLNLSQIFDYCLRESINNSDTLPELREIKTNDRPTLNDPTISVTDDQFSSAGDNPLDIEWE